MMVSPSQLHSWPSTVTEFFQFNTTLPPFDDVRVRRALNFAIDRRALVRVFGGPEAASPTCQILPPSTPGYERYCPYTIDPDRGIWKAPNLHRARRLIAASGTRGTRITVWGWTDDPALRPELIRYTANLLRRLGYPTRIRLVAHAALAHAPASVFRKIQLIPTEWGDTSYGFFATWFSCAGGSSQGGSAIRTSTTRITVPIRYRQQGQRSRPRSGRDSTVSSPTRPHPYRWQTDARSISSQAVCATIRLIPTGA